MKNRYVIAIQSGTPAQRNAITTYLKGKYGFWHWMPDVWLVTGTQDLEANEMRDDIRALVPGLRFIVLKVANQGWSGYGKTNWWEWLRKNWE